MPPAGEPAAPIRVEAPPPPAEPEAAPVPGAHAGSLADRFGGSYVDWWHEANVEYFGVGSSYAGTEDYHYTTGWALSPSFFVYREGRHQIRVRTTLGWSVELTNSNTTTQKNELELHDLPLTASDAISLFSWGGVSAERPGPAAAFNPTLEGGGENNTWLVPWAGVVFPTSKYSQTTNYLATRLGLDVRQRIKLAGSASPLFPSLILSLGESWRHDFNKANVQVGSPTIVRQDASGHAIVSDQLSKWLLATDRLSTDVGVVLPIYKGLELSFGFSYLVTFKPTPKGTCVQLATGCIDPTPSPTATSTQLSYTDLDIGLAYRPIPELVIGLDYETFRLNQDLGPSAQSNVFYAPGGSTFYADVAFFPAELVKRLQKPAPPPDPPVDGATPGN